jgi:hypothetical protein
VTERKVMEMAIKNGQVFSIFMSSSLFLWRWNG